MSIQRFEVGPRMSQAVVHGDTVYLAGQVANNPAATVAKQTKQILSQIDKPRTCFYRASSTRAIRGDPELASRMAMASRNACREAGLRC